MKKYLLVCLVSCCFSAIEISAQVSKSNNSTYQNIIGSSPNVAALNKYGETPVNMYTGVPNIEIPIYTIKDRDLSIPISLSYHSGGIRVDEEASRVGLGWVLQAGGEISRSIRGRDDFFPQYGYVNNTKPEVISDTYFSRFQNNTLYPSTPCNFSGETFSNVSMDAVVGGSQDVDLEPDSYSFNIGDQSGQFIVKKNEDVLQAKPKGLEIKLSDATYNNTKWQIRKADGTILLFEKLENTIETSSSGSTQYTTVWYLTKVISPLGATATFNYTTLPSVYISDIGRISQMENIKQFQVKAGGSGNGPSCSLPATGPVQTAGNQQSHDLVTLTSIVFNGGQLNFTYSDRIDISGDKKLDKITVVNTANAYNNVDFVLNQDYFTANANIGGGYAQGLSANILNKRLKLLSVSRKTSDTSATQNYQFQYDESYLPQKDSYARDFWGFYNGANNRSLLPSLSYGLYGSTAVNTYVGANRNPNPAFAQAFILKQIQYPTGGLTKFEYESNDFDLGNSINLSQAGASLSNYQTGVTSHTDSYALLRGYDVTYTYDMRNASTNPAKLYINLYAGYGENPDYISTDPNKAYLKVFQKGSTTPLQTVLLGRNDSWTRSSSSTFDYVTNFTLTPGEYRLEFHADNSLLFFRQISIQTNWLEEENRTDNHTIKAGGGLRIKRVTNIPDEADQTNILVKKYEYHYKEDRDADSVQEEYSFGKRMAPFQFFNIEERGVSQYDPSGPNCSLCSDLKIYSNSLNTVNNIGYSSVVEFIGENGEGGKSVYTYTNDPDLILSYVPDYSVHMFGTSVTPYININNSNRPAGLSNFGNVQNGNLISQVDSIFIPTLNQFKKLRELTNFYALRVNNTQSVYGLRAMQENYDPIGSPSCFSSSPCYVHLAQYPLLQSGVDFLTTKTERTFDPNTGSYVEQKTDYFYEAAPTHYQPLQIRTTLSDGEKLHTFNTYAADFSAGSDFIDSMKVKHIIGIPVETVQAREDINGNFSIMNGRITKYKTDKPALLSSILLTENADTKALSSFKFSNVPLGALPTSTTHTSYQPDGIYKTDRTFDNYDSDNNLVQQTKVNDVSECYLWGYNGSYPVAKITGATYSSAVALINPTILDNASNQYTDLQIRNELNKLRTGLPKALVTTYTYLPLVGIISETDPSGKVTFYEYDTMGRLRLIKDLDGKIVKQFDYKYNKPVTQ